MPFGGPFDAVLVGVDAISHGVPCWSDPGPCFSSRAYASARRSGLIEDQLGRLSRAKRFFVRMAHASLPGSPQKASYQHVR